MTIIAGFPIKGHVILGADGEEGNGYSKAAVKKLVRIEGEDYRCVIGGTGSGNFIDLAVQQAKRRLTPGLSADAVREALEEIVTTIYLHRIDTFPPHERDRAGMQLLCALWTKNTGGAQLVRVGRAYSLIRDHPDVVGIGSDLARYVIETFYPGQGASMHPRNLERLCAYVLATVKAHVQGCGGLSQIIVMGPDGETHEISQAIIREDEASTDLVMGGAVSMLFHWIDPVGWRGDLAQLDTVVDETAELLKKDLRAHMAIWRPASEKVEPNP